MFAIIFLYMCPFSLICLILKIILFHLQLYCYWIHWLHNHYILLEISILDYWASPAYSCMFRVLKILLQYDYIYFLNFHITLFPKFTCHYYYISFEIFILYYWKFSRIYILCLGYFNLCLMIWKFVQNIFLNLLKLISS